MRKGILSSSLLVAVVAAAIYGCLVLQSGYRLFGWVMGPAFLLLWPSLLLSRCGIPVPWFVLAVTLVLACAWVGWVVRRRWLAALPIGLAIGLTYCLAGALAFRCLSVPVPPVTPYDHDGAKRGAYREAYDEGYRWGIGGVFRTYCFAPKPDTQGFYEGMMEGLRIQNQVLGRPSWNERTRDMARVSAGRDGVSLDPDKESVEPVAAPTAAAAQ